MSEDEFNKLFDGFGEEQKLLGYPMMTDEQAAIIGHFISYLENAKLIGLATYNPETHLLIAKDEVPMGLKDALKHSIFIQNGCKPIMEAAALIAAKMEREGE